MYNEKSKYAAGYRILSDKDGTRQIVIKYTDGSESAPYIPNKYNPVMDPNSYHYQPKPESDIDVKRQVKNVKRQVTTNNKEETSLKPPSKMKNNYSIPTTKPPVPVENINMCFVGGVSTGKSTLLNGIFCEQLTQCKIKRTTMVPTIYVENENDTPNLNLPEDIYATISAKNDEIIRLTEQSTSSKTNRDTYRELVFNVGKLDINILPDAYVNVYDIPGLNDARTKNTYYDYLDKTFSSFNLVVLLVDIHSGLNTSDELDIVRFITDRTKKEMTKNNKIYTLVVVNKADDMQLPEDGDGNTLQLTGELNEMFQQVETTIGDEFGKKGLIEHIIGIIPLCAVDAYLYRMVMKHQSKFELTPEQILKIGVNENGKKFSTLKPNTQKEKVYAILKDENFIKTMIKLSGFSKFESILHDFLNGTNKVGSELRINNIINTISTFPSLTDAIIDCNYSDTTIKTFINNLVSQYIDHYNIIKKIDRELYKFQMDLCLTSISNAISHNIQKMDDPTQILTYYETMKTTILNIYFKKFITDKYPEYVTDHIIVVCDRITKKNVSIKVINEVFTIFHTIGVYNEAFPIISDIINRDEISNKVLCNKIETVDYDNIISHLTTLNKGTTKTNNQSSIISNFIRVLLISKYSQPYSNVHWNAYILFKKYRELIMSSYLETFVNNSSTNNYKNYILGIDPTFENSDNSSLEMFYIHYEHTYHPYHFSSKSDKIYK
jgi:GTP-binding protein EngB required for normal cell division